LIALSELQIANNQPTGLPKSLGQMQNLGRLDLPESLPPTLGQLERLHLLELYGDRLIHLPESIGDLSRLALLNLSRIRVCASKSHRGEDAGLA
jgi:Leucine-rich repeat (LRR) protein